MRPKWFDDSELLDTLQAAQQFGLWSVQVPGQTHWWSEQTRTILGVPEHTAASRETLYAVIVPEDRKRVAEEYVAIASGVSRRALQCQIRRPVDGVVRTIQLRGATATDKAGNVVGVIGTISDETEHVDLESALKRSEEKWRSIATTPYDFVVLIDPAGVFLWANQFAEGVSPEETIGHSSVHDWIDPPSQAAMRVAIQAAFERSELTTVEAYSPTLDRWFQNTVGPVVENDTVICASVLSIDITEKKRTLELLVRSERMLREAERIAQVGSWTWTPENDTLEWSTGMYDLFGLPHGTPPSQELYFSLLHPEDRETVVNIAGTSIERGESFRHSYRIIRRDNGEVRYMETSGEFVREGNTVLGFFGTTLDITARRKLEEALLHRQKLEAIGRLAGGIAHDFNNLLTAITGNAELIQAAAEQDPSADPTQFTEQILFATRSASDLTRQMLGFARKQLIIPRLINPHEHVAAVSKLLLRVLGEHVSLSFRVEPDVPTIFLDPGQIEQLLMNLAVNARDAMPRGGELTISVRSEAVSDEMSNVDLPVGNYVVFEVADTGHGVPEEIRAQIFEPFFTTKPIGVGSGLGLATCYGIVKQNHGHIECESTPGNGTTFRIFLPARTVDAGE